MNVRSTVLIVDDDPIFLQAHKACLADHYNVHAFSSPSLALEHLQSYPVDVVLLDLGLGHVDGKELLLQWKRLFPLLEIIICSGQLDMRIAVECMRFGASDYLVKPSGREDVLFTLARTLEKRELKRKIEKLDPLIKPQPVKFIGSSSPINKVLEKSSLLKGQTHLNVLILGESGTGKEILARTLHQQENDRNRPFVAVNMPAIPASLMESELFGVEKGAFTDAKTTRPGKFELADGGDIFLDEIGDLPLEMQSKLLRVLQERQIQRVGSNQLQNLSFRTISATNRPLAELMNKGEFREDLVYRLSDLVLWLPPLRERPEDIPELVHHFIHRHHRGTETPQVSTELMDKLKKHRWPGNTRELESAIKRSLLFSKGTLEDIEIYDSSLFAPQAPLSQKQGSGDFETQTKSYEKRILEEALSKYGGKKNEAMSELGLTKATFYRKLQEFGLS